MWLTDGEKNLKICLFISTDTNVTDRQTQTDGETDGPTLHDGIGRADAQTREEKWQLNDTAALSVLVQV